MATTARAQFQEGFATYITAAGLMTDELQADDRPSRLLGSDIAQDIQLDARLLDQNADWSNPQGAGMSSDGLYGILQLVRTLARQAIGALAAYAPATSANARGELYALLGYTEVMLGDFYCSGVPLSTLDFNGDFTYQPGSTTQQIYTHAIALFDTAQTLAADSAPIVYLAQVGQGRAYLALGQYAAAGQAVSGVPLGFQYVDSVYTCDNRGEYNCGANNNTRAMFLLPAYASVADLKGNAGRPFVSSGDPRTASSDNNPQTQNDDWFFNIFLPQKYSVLGVSALTVASGIEAQLISAEAQLNAGNATAAFATLNALRSGSSLTAGKLPTLTDPGTLTAEVDTLFAERAAWLFVDGHRQGDLRRLSRNYQRGHAVYPQGAFPGGLVYGNFIDAPIPATELANPHFTGCLGRD